MRDHNVAGARELSLVHLALAVADRKLGAEIHIAPPLDLYDEDIVRVRSRFVRAFLETDCTDVLWVDADMSFTPLAVAGLLASGRDFVACPYPRKKIHWDDVRADRRGDPEAAAYHYAITLLPGGIEFDEGTQTGAIAGIGLGLALTSRVCLQGMVDHYRDALEFDDLLEGGPKPTVALFQLLMPRGESGRRGLLSEDHSFCRRWRDIGGDVHMYLGPGSPVDHVGPHYFRGHRKAFTR
jgi:hypothetical protein